MVQVGAFSEVGRRRLFEFGGAWAAAGVLAASRTRAAYGMNLHAPAAQSPAPMYMFIGTYTTNNRAEGLYVHRMDPGTGALTPLHTITGPGTENGSFVAMDRQRRYLYVVNEVGNFEGSSGSVSAFAIDAATGNLTFLNRVNSQGQISAHLTVDPVNKHVLVANYNGNNVATFPIMADGKLGEAVDIDLHAGMLGPSQARQERPHPHAIEVDPSGKFVLACDLGLDRVMIYRYDASTGKLEPNWIPFIQVSSGAGPRHMSFSPAGRHLYILNEIDNTVGVFTWDATRGIAQSIQTVPTLPDDFTGVNTTAEIVVHPSGRFVYASNRGHHSIAMFGVMPQTGKLTSMGQIPTQGDWPRNIAIDPSGTFLFAANERSNNIVSFRVNQNTGILEPTGNVIETKAPVCLIFKPI